MNSAQSEPDNQLVKPAPSTSAEVNLNKSALLQQFSRDFSNHIFISVFVSALTRKATEQRRMIDQVHDLCKT